MSVVLQLIQQSKVSLGPLEAEGLASIFVILMVASPICFWSGKMFLKTIKGLLTRRFSKVSSKPIPTSNRSNDGCADATG